jgi:small subunit ribosomal protein S7
MPRKGPAPKRPLVIDPVYGSPVVTQLINKVLLDGKKSTAEAIVYGALEGVREKTAGDPVVVLKRALENVRPALEVRSRRVERLMNEILDASNGLGAAVKRREDIHKMAESNKAFAHYRW